MNKDALLINEALDVFKRLRDWVPADFYREAVMPTVNRLKDRLAVIETEEFVRERKQLHQQYEDTVPSQLDDLSSKFGLFNPKDLK